MNTESSKRTGETGEKNQKMIYFHPHTPFPCIRQCIVNLKRYRNQMDRAVLLKSSGQKPGLLCFCVYSHLVIATCQQVVAT